ncbi:electron transfer flavoprotein subunit beta/FixA family protein [Kribbella sp. NPDC050124]|uniref:electron transfer flavoprotein subunit beta/FixA family protein n=1 Tax=Kribbella sp. NPDC050124 TaxID=3364114 RepID=UPI0037A5AF18
MNIVVCLKYVPDATAERRFQDDFTVDRAGVDGLLSELDEYAVEQALRIKESRDDDTQVIVLTVGPENAIDAARKALQIGADRAVHVVDDAIAGSDAPATSLVLAEAVKTIPHDLVICGMGSTDAVMGVVPAMLAERLGVPGVTFASALSLDGGTVVVRRDSDVATETVEAGLPCVVSVTDQSGDARYPSFKGIMAAKKKEIVTRSLSDLGISAGQVGLAAARTVVESVAARPPRSKGEIVTDDDGSGAKALVDFLAAGKFV